MIARRVAEMAPFLAMDILDRACALEREGARVIHMEVGEPDFDAPACVREALCRALADGRTHYTHSLGDPALREAICQYYETTYGVRIHPDQVIVTSGTSPAMLLLFGALLEAGDEVIVSDPGYACYANAVRFADGVAVPVPVDEEDGFQLHVEEVCRRLSARTRALVINSPSNPTGTLLSPEHMAALAGLPALVISDEIYHGLVYGGNGSGERQERSILEYTDRAVVLNGFSKQFAMTGLRLGYLIAPRDLVRPMQKVAQNLFISANSAVQYAGIAALECGAADVAHMREVYNTRRVYMVERLRRMGLGIAVEPTGAFYVFANARHISEDSLALAHDILERAHVGVAPGIDFGRHGEGFLRFSYATSLDQIAEGLDRLERYLAERGA